MVLRVVLGIEESRSYVCRELAKSVALVCCGKAYNPVERLGDIERTPCCSSDECLYKRFMYDFSMRHESPPPFVVFFFTASPSTLNCPRNILWKIDLNSLPTFRKVSSDGISGVKRLPVARKSLCNLIYDGIPIHSPLKPSQYLTP